MCVVIMFYLAYCKDVDRQVARIIGREEWEERMEDEGRGILKDAEGTDRWQR